MPPMQTVLDILQATWGLALAAAPWLVVGLIVAALIKVYVPASWLTGFLHGRGGVIKAALIGAPLPLCSCGVIPAALALRRQGASRGSVMSFLVATPETGVDSVAVSYALLGPFLAVVRPIAAIFSAIVAGLMGAALDAREAQEPSQGKSSAVPKSSCCSSGSGAGEAVVQTAGEPASAGGCCGGEREEPVVAGGCCSSEQEEPVSAGGCCEGESKSAKIEARPRLGAALVSASGDILDDTVKWLALGLVMAGAMSVWITGDMLASWGSGLPVMILMVLVGIPMYICATGSTPLAAGLLIGGLSPGAVLVFMLAGPATNIATLGVVRKELGTRYMVAYLVAVAGSAIACGLVTDAIAAMWGIDAMAQAKQAHTHGLVPHWLAVLSLVALVLLAIKPLRQTLVRSPKANMSDDGSSSTTTPPALDDRS